MKVKSKIKPDTPVSFSFGKSEESIAAVVVVRVPTDCCLQDLKHYPEVRQILADARDKQAYLLFDERQRENRIRYLLRRINLTSVVGKQPDLYYLLPEHLIAISD